MGATIVFKIPVFRDMMLWLGIVDADRELVEEILRRDYTLVTLQGGISEVRTLTGRLGCASLLRAVLLLLLCLSSCFLACFLGSL